MGKNKFYNDKNNKKIVDVESSPAENTIEQTKPTLENGNYVIEIVSEDQVIKKIVVANSKINITKLRDGGLAVDLK